MKIFLKYILIILKPFKSIIVFLLRLLSYFAREINSLFYRLLYLAEWGIPDQPSFFDHEIDLFYLLLKRQKTLFLERGILNSFVIKENSKLLEIGCGDGFFSKHFYSLKANKIVACDINKDALFLAKYKNKDKKIEYMYFDILKDIPKGVFDNVIMDAVIDYFTYDEIISIIKKIKTILSPGGVFSGYTIAKINDEFSWHFHKYEFESSKSLQEFLKKYFKYSFVFETKTGGRDNLYFFASDNDINPLNKLFNN